ncbi:MAG TPA: MBL fold metallo-hydrolase [Burkholderiales bacterium]|nr:MBL fold metallo-hydrolase [Burkholderiales bacterium]
MRVTFWGTRGSIATPGAGTTTYGGNTSCVEVRCGTDILIFDAGTGIRPLGLALAQEFKGRPLTLHLFISHTHWDHIQGFPFFTPAYLPTTTIHIYGSGGAGRPLEKVLRGQMDADYFPVALGDMSSTLNVHEFKGKPFQVGAATIAATYLNHPGMNLAYRLCHEGKSVVYATDNEPYQQTLTHLGERADAGRDFGQKLDAEFVQFLSGADLYIGEAQYTDEEYPGRIGWGHSSISATVEVALEAQVGTLAFFHHDPLHDDPEVAKMAEQAIQMIGARNSSLQCFAAREGQTLDV